MVAPVAPVEPDVHNRCMFLLRRCSSERHLRAAHALFLVGRLHLHPFVLSRLILAACSLRPPALPYASLLFHHSPYPPSTFAHNALIRAHARSPHPRAALPLFRRLLASAAADHHSFPFVLAACAANGSLVDGAQVHALVVKNGLSSADPYVQTALLRLYSHAIDDAPKLFDEIPNPDAVHYDVLMNVFIRRGVPSEALRLFDRLLLSNLEPDNFAVTTALTACAHAGALEQGVRIHKYLASKDASYAKDTFLGSALVSMYAKCGCIKDAVEVFDAVPNRNNHMWATMIGAYAMHGFPEKAIACVRRMQEVDQLRPDGVVLLGALAACAHAGRVEDGLLLLGDMEAKYAVAPEHEHYSCAVDMLCRVGRLEEALLLIRRMPMRPLASVWGSLLTGCRIQGNVELAETAVAELQRFTESDGDDEGVYVQLSNIYLNANRKEEACKVRKLVGSRGSKKTPARSAIHVEGKASSFVAGDQAHPRRTEIWTMLELLTDHISSCTEDDRPSSWI
ncbi:putative pentatricopeptide repeat-containing protein At3g28640 [Zingiber officinale]|uniref:Pentatricopeptide repeat-containing protein n=1 Tax=Zingiber officinale TaxID=94328 RepID=A0A8J5HUM9_ZINOF|nr:putative pentatricopeptide repeat-containing protein At3g28640 [Zingiber officinale]KAG6525574.1 hypothetical protein ZIOFF_015536 [Zingiber officinale]